MITATGKLRGLAVTAPQRVASIKDVPTVVEQGFPNLVLEDYVGYAVKSGTPKEIVDAIAQASREATEAIAMRSANPCAAGREPRGA